MPRTGPIWRPGDIDIEGFVCDVQVGMRQTVLDNSKEDRARFDHLLKDADVFFANRRPGCLEAYTVSCRERKCDGVEK